MKTKKEIKKELGEYGMMSAIIAGIGGFLIICAMFQWSTSPQYPFQEIRGLVMMMGIILLWYATVKANIGIAKAQNYDMKFWIMKKANEVPGVKKP